MARKLGEVATWTKPDFLQQRWTSPIHAAAQLVSACRPYLSYGNPKRAHGVSSTNITSSMAAEVSTSQAAGRQKVLDEDEWTECVEAIIQRDYFPIVPKLQNKLEWLEVSIGTLCICLPTQSWLLLSFNSSETMIRGLQAVRSRDPELLRQAQLNIAQRRAGIKTPMGATPAHFATPGMTSFRAPPSMLRTPGGVRTPGPGNMDGSEG